jgi:photosystem II stability/assembly factor-like uncharacterized protein
MKIRIIFILSAIFVSSAFAQQWKVLSTPDFKKALTDIYMVSDKEGWTVGNGGSIYHTTDGFKTVELQNSNVTKNLAKVYFADASTGWVATTAGTVLKTNDGGKTWTEVSFASLVKNITFAKCGGLYFVDSSTGFIVAGKTKAYYIFKTVDGGQNWALKDSLVDAKTSKAWTDIRFFDKLNGVIVGDIKGTQKYTEDGGESWKDGDSVVYSTGNSSVRYLDSKTLIAVGEGNAYSMVALPVFKSTDGGKTWVNKTETSTVFERIQNVYFKDAMNGIAVGNNGFDEFFTYSTKDGGETWTPAVGSYGAGLLSVSGVGNSLFAIGSGSHIFTSSDFGTSWDITKFKSLSKIADITFVGSKGYAINTNGDFFSYNSSDKSWTFLSTTGFWDAGAIKFIDENTGFALKENRHILKTVDGGLSWKTVLAPAAYNTFSKVGGLYFVNSKVGYAYQSIGAYATYSVYKTTDGGDNWAEVYNNKLGGGYGIANLTFFDELNGVITGPKYANASKVKVLWLKYTQDGGTTWTDANITGVPAKLTTGAAYDVARIDENSAVIAGSKFLLKTSDKGVNWSYIDHKIAGVDSSFYGVTFKGQKGAVVDYDGSLLLTADGGSTWTANTDEKKAYIFNRVALDADNNPLIGTADGSILTYAVATSVDDKDNSAPSSYSLSQNYPNPFNPATTISFSLKKRSNVELSVYNLLGQKVATIVNGSLEAGEHTVNFNAAALSSGIYIYTMKTGEISFTKKMIVLK